MEGLKEIDKSIMDLTNDLLNIIFNLGVNEANRHKFIDRIVSEVGRVWIQVYREGLKSYKDCP